MLKEEITPNKILYMDDSSLLIPVAFFHKFITLSSTHGFQLLSSLSISFPLPVHYG